MGLVEIADLFAADLERLSFSLPVTHVYNPLVYAREPFGAYLDRCGRGGKEALFLGMNPGPWGMAQTGVPFGEVSIVQEWMKIGGMVRRPPGEHPKKRVDGFACRRSEVSGRRLWGLFRKKYPESTDFFARFFVLNYCPLLFIDADGRNITPDRLATAERNILVSVCDETLRRTVAELRPGIVIGVGNFAAARAGIALEGTGVRVGRILHPSPANPRANRDWEGIVVEELRAEGVEL